MTVNAFHPDYMKTYEPNFMKDFRTFEANRQAAATLTKHVEKVRKTKPSHGTVFGISDKPVSLQPKKMMVKKKMPILTKAEQSKTMKEISDELIARLKVRVKK